MSGRATLWVRNPPCDQLLACLDSGDGVAFAKRTHGIWDHLALLTTGGWTADEYRRCDQMIFKRTAEPTLEVVRQRQAYLEYLEEILDDVVRPPDDPRWIQTISLDLDYLTGKLRKPAFSLRASVDPRLLSYWQWDYSYGDLIRRFELGERPFQFAQTLTRGLVSLSLLELPQIARRYHVVVVAPEKMRDLADRWHLDPEHFTFQPSPPWPDRRPNGSLFSDPVLPALRTHVTRHRLLEQLQSITTTRPRLYLFELGTCAQWLIARLFRARPGDSYLDMGRCLEAWYPDTPWPLKAPVAAVYRRAAQAYYGRARYLALRARS
ncbi:hypothetical protein ACWEV9_27385 [Streptomyces albogriseolus]|uniref:hypothetical protein n=1 Tax=Streptomyces sp. NPDC001388 TaxID=3364568 RepID=UPI00368F39EA